MLSPHWILGFSGRYMVLVMILEDLITCIVTWNVIYGLVIIFVTIVGVAAVLGLGFVMECYRILF